MKLIIGLGNHPEKYHQTRHNFGFLFLDFLAKKHSFPDFKSEKKFYGQLSQGLFQEEKTLLLKPETYMNLSGKALQAVTDYYKILPEDIWLIYDDIDLPLGTVRFRERGRSGGHRGVTSVLQHLNTQELRRIKLGIANEQREKLPTEAFVLQAFSEEEWAQIDTIFDQAHGLLSQHWNDPS